MSTEDFSKWIKGKQAEQARNQSPLRRFADACNRTADKLQAKSKHVPFEHGILHEIGYSFGKIMGR